MSTPLVTIITATYNRPAMFAECAAAVLAQSFTDWQWWVVFNCENYPWEYSHATPKLWSDPRVQSHWFPVADCERDDLHWPATIVNWLYPKVTTPYIYWLSDDDLIDPDGLGVLVEAAQPKIRAMTRAEMGEWGGAGITTEKERYDAVYGRCEVVDQQPDGSYKTACWCYPGEHTDGVVEGIHHPSTTMGGVGDWDVGLGTGISPHCRLDGGQVLHTADLWRRATADGWQLTDSKADAASNDGTLLARLAKFARFHYVSQRIVTHRRHAGAAFHRPQLEGR